MTFGRRTEKPVFRRNAITIRSEHDSQVAELVTEAIINVAKRRGLALAAQTKGRILVPSPAWAKIPS